MCAVVLIDYTELAFRPIPAQKPRHAVFFCAEFSTSLGRAVLEHPQGWPWYSGTPTSFQSGTLIPWCRLSQRDNGQTP